MNVPTACIEGIKSLGYTESEARFLYIVAVFSGYFTLGQFRAFTGSHYGNRPTSFAQKLVRQPVLKKLGIPMKFAGLHAFRHGLATELADKNTPIPVLQKQMRDADVRTTLEVYAHVIPLSQRDAMEAVSIGTVQLWNTKKQ